MEGKLQYLTQRGATLQFGKPEISKVQNEFYDDLNNEIFLIIKSLPASVQTRVLLELMDHLGLSARNASDFFAGFYTPAWSILYWLAVSFSHNGKLPAAEMKNIKSVHASAMLLHLLDDHLHDGEIPATHLTILLRSQVWMFMNQALQRIAESDSSGAAIAERFLDDYYASTVASQGVDSLDAYCDLFKKQMGTGFIAPVLMAKKLTADDQVIKAVQATYGAFGTAWRLLDDLQDIPQDLQTGAKSAVYICLPEEGRRSWENNCLGDDSAKTDPSMDIVACLKENKVTEKIQQRICSELDSAASISDAFKIKGFARELRRLREPLMPNKEPHAL